MKNNTFILFLWITITCFICQNFAILLPRQSVPSAPQINLAKTVINAWDITVVWSTPFDGGSKITSYVLEQSNWWQNVTTPTIQVYNGLDNQFDSNVLTPASTYLFRVKAVNVIGPSPWSPVVPFTTHESGSCGNAKDVQIEKDKFSIVKSTIQGCLISCALYGEACAVDCIVKELGFSHNCAQCWGDMGVCILSNCKLPCVFPNSESCKNCAHKYCFPETVKCTGLPSWAIPS